MTLWCVSSPKNDTRLRLVVLVAQFYSDRAQFSPNLFLARAAHANGQIQGHFAQRPLIIPDPAIRAKYQDFLDTTQLNHNSTFGAERMIAAYQYCGPWLDCRQTGLTAAEIMNRVVDVAGIGLYSGTEFGREEEGFFRMNLACPRSLLERGLQGIEEAFKGS